MIKNLFISLFRQFRKTRLVILLNLTGLTVGLTCAMLGLMFLINEWSFDTMHDKGDRIYRLYKKNVSINDGTQVLTAETSGLMGPTLVDDYAEVERTVRILPWFDETVISYRENHQKSGLVLFADSSFFDVFSFRLLRGSPSEALTRPSSIVLTESMARRLFGNEDPLGQTVIGLHDLEYEVTGIAADAPSYSHIQFDALISWVTTVPGQGPLEYDFMNNWLGQTLFTYLLMSPEADVARLEGEMQNFMRRHFEERADSYFLRFQPLQDVYMGSENIKYGRSLLLGNPRYSYTFLAAAFFVLLIACINYINIQTARASRRASEIGIRKVLGAGRRQLAWQFFGETFLFVLIAAVFSVLLADLVLPSFNELAGLRLPENLMLDHRVSAGMLGIVVLTALLAGIYPALILASSAPATTIKNISGRSQGILSRKVLITFQYVVAIVLIACSIIIFMQTKYMMDRDLGFDADQVLVLNINNGIDARHEEFVNRLRSNPGIRDVTVSQSSVGTGWFGTTIIPEGSEKELSVSIFRIGVDFFSTLRIDMEEGRTFREGSPRDSASVIINQSMADLLGYDNPLEHSIRFGPNDSPRPIIGVSRDFHYEAMNQGTVRPTVMYLHPSNLYNVTMRIEKDQVAETLAFLADTWSRFEDRFPFDYYFLNDWFASHYSSEKRLLSTILVYASISVLLSFLGLYGLMTHLIEQRLKEFSIRKVLGASHFGITMSVNTSLSLLVLTGFIIGGPAAWWFTTDWLEGFAYRIDDYWWVFPSAALLVLLITITTVSIQFWHSARVNPAEILRNE